MENETSEGDVNISLTFHRGSTGEVWLYVDEQIAGVYANTTAALAAASVEVAEELYGFEGEDADDE